MPYINKEDRRLIDTNSVVPGMDGLDAFIDKLEALRESLEGEHMARPPGTLNYIITRLCDFWYRDFSGEANYEKYNAVIGALECVKQELYRRQIAPYEDEKWQQNGDVYRS